MTKNSELVEAIMKADPEKVFTVKTTLTFDQEYTPEELEEFQTFTTEELGERIEGAMDDFRNFVSNDVGGIDILVEMEEK